MEQKEKISIEHLINIIIALVGLLLVIIGIVISSREKASTILISVGASLIASSIVAFLSSIYMQKYRRAKEIYFYKGLKRSSLSK